MAHRRTAECAVATLLLGLTLPSACGTARSTDSAPDPASSFEPQSTSISESPEESNSPAQAEFPPGFAKTMRTNGYVLEDPGSTAPGATRAEAIENARSFYGLFDSDDPVTAGFFKVTTPDAGPLESPGNPESKIIHPTLDKLPMWVVYARAEMPRDERNPELGLVTGTVVVFVDATNGKAQSAITY